MIARIGIVGFGSFGELMACLLAPHAEILVYSRREVPAESLPDNVRVAKLEEVAACPVVMLANDLASLEEACEKLKPFVKSDTIVLDVCSVKVKPAEILQQVLGDSCRLLATHPLFGPESYKKRGTTKNFKLVWHELQGGPFPELEELFGLKLQLQIMRIDPETHDQHMAWVHGLSFFVGRGLLKIDPPESALGTPYYGELMDLVNLEKKQSYELFMTIQQGNPYTDEIRQKFMMSLQELETEIMRSRVDGRI